MADFRGGGNPGERVEDRGRCLVAGAGHFWRRGGKEKTLDSRLKLRE